MIKNDLLKTQFENLGLTYSDDIEQKFDKYCSFLLSENEKYNLTSIKDPEAVYSLHFADSLFGVNYIPKNSEIVDIGAGAGFPSVPLKIARNDLNLTMIDSISKKVNFLNTLISDLSISNALAIHTRIEDFARTSSRESFDVAVARAVAPLPTLLEYAIPLLKVNGKFVAYKGKIEEELKTSEKALKELGCEIETVDSFKFLDADRCILVIKKTAPTKNIYPRGKNLERKKPIV